MRNISSRISTVSALLLASGGLSLLFASDVLLPVLSPNLPSAAAWLGQLVAGAWLSVAVFNWNARSTVLGGIYGRPAVNLNLVLYVVSALAMLKADAPTLALRVATVPVALMAIVYAALLLRGPFDRLHRDQSHHA
jgi:hypothetical protein